ncbi:MAG: S-adenosylmethionine:tRNA ribosyltransferase-isomerase [Actinomycetota bacterium]|nr:S-adenosylmethionine:tRNA ribosyltransferase-isomerase [Actinomycetota bacterium]
MTATLTDSAPALPGRLPLNFRLDAAHEAHEPPENRGSGRDDVRLMVSAGERTPEHSTFPRLPDHLADGDVVVVNTSATLPAAIDATDAKGHHLVIHVSTELPGGLWMVEARRRLDNGSTSPHRMEPRTQAVRFDDGTELTLLRRAPGSDRLWIAAVADDAELVDLLGRNGRAIRYSYVPRDWPIGAYQTVFATEPGSAEMPSAARPFTHEIVTQLVSRGVAIAPITLHTGVSSLEGHELPYPERYEVPASTADLVNSVHRSGGHVIAAGTTVVRALETTVDPTGTVHPGRGWTDVVITPTRGVGAVDGLLTGWHEPAATHLAMLEAIAGRPPLLEAYEAAFDAGYLWHEFGDSHLLLPYA